MSRTQDASQARVVCGLGPDTLLLRRLAGTEGLGQLFEYHLDLLSEDPALALTDLVGQPLSVELQQPAGGTRYFDGIVSRFGQTDSDGRLAAYRAIIVPKIWLLSRTSDCRIFQELTVVEIVDRVLREAEITNYRFELAESYPVLDYCVQYRETDLNFISRLLEEFGIYYAFEHHADGHELVLCDSPGFHKPMPGYEVLRYVEPTEDQALVESVRSWTAEAEVQSGVYAHTDFDFRKPRVDLETRALSTRDKAHLSLEIYDYPGSYREIGNGETIAHRRMQELEARLEVRTGRTNARGIAAGHTFEFEDAPRPDDERAYLITTASHRIEVEAPDSGTEGGELVYDGAFTVIDAQQPYRPARMTPRPVIQGAQTAVVTGPEGEEIWTDEFGRVKVTFPWDRRSAADETSSCWIRVSQAWAGRQWGAVFLPRVGQEVIVEFLEGDPDRPIITGRVYNASQMPPAELPRLKHISGFKTNTLEQGGNYNALSFCDLKEEELLRLRAARDREDLTLHDLLQKTDHDRHEVVGNNTHERIGQDRHEIVEHNHFEEVKRDYHLTIGGKAVASVGGSLDVTAGAVTESFSSQDTEVGGPVTIKGTDITLDATSSITLQCGGSSIKISAGSIQITAPGTVEVNGSSIDLVGATINADAGYVQTPGVFQASTVIATNVISSTYTPGAGNTM